VATAAVDRDDSGTGKLLPLLQPAVLMRIQAELVLCVPRPQEAESQDLVCRLGKSQMGIG
jgi:hypothetical protein